MRSVFFEKSIPRVLITLGLKQLSRRAVSGPWSPVRYRNLPEPALPGPRGIRVRNHQCGVCATDLHLVAVDVDPQTFALTGRWIREGRISTEGLITHRFPLDDWKRAVRVAGDKRQQSIKVMLDCQR